MPLVSAPELQQLATRILEQLGSDASEAQVVAQHLVDSNLAGHDSHGVGMLPTYAQSIQRQALFPNQSLAKVGDLGAILQFDGQRGYGQVMARQAMQAAIERASQHGLCLVTLRNAHHVGRIGTYGEQVTQAGYLSLHFVNATDMSAIVAPWGGRKPAYITNPICIAIPGRGQTPAVMLDMATSHIALGKTRVAYNKGVAVPWGTVMDDQGQPSDDPKYLWQEPKGALMPTGEHKGSGLALMCELLGGVMSGNGTIREENERRGGIVNSMFSLVVNPQALGDLPWMQAEIDATLAYVKAIPPADPARPVLLAGEPERIARAQRLADGIPVDDTTWDQLQRLL